MKRPEERARPVGNGGETPPLQDHRGWHHPRSLPHFDSPEVPQSVTFRLADSLPRHVAEARKGEGGDAYARRIDAALDSGMGECWLKRPDIAGIVESVLRHGHDVSYDLHAYVVMPNHVHVLITQRQGHRLADIVQAWKGYSAKRINETLGRKGTVWQRDYFDRFVRDEAHFEAARFYIENNPVSADLAERPEGWRFSSAWERARPVRETGDGTSPLR